MMLASIKGLTYSLEFASIDGSVRYTKEEFEVPCKHNPCTLVCMTATTATRTLADWIGMIADIIGDVALASLVLAGGYAIQTLPNLCKV